VHRLRLVATFENLRVDLATRPTGPRRQRLRDAFRVIAEGEFSIDFGE
jgi:hypothetical protein